MCLNFPVIFLWRYGCYCLNLAKSLRFIVLSFRIRRRLLNVRLVLASGLELSATYLKLGGVLKMVLVDTLYGRLHNVTVFLSDVL